MRITIRWLENWKDRIHKQGYSDGYNAHAVSILGIREEEKKIAFQKGRNFEFKTINTHLEAMYRAQMSQNVEWVVERFREITEEMRLHDREASIQKKV